MIALKRFDAAVGMLRNEQLPEGDRYALTQRFVKHPQVPQQLP